MSSLYIEKSKNIAGKKEYDKLYSQASDSIKKWAQLKLISYDEFSNGFILDKVICVNNCMTKSVMALSYQLENSQDHDGMEFFYGTKIKDTWYFFTGAAIHLPREFYQSDIHTPLSFEKLHEIALKEVFSGYLKEKERPFWEFWKPVEYEPNEAWFDYHFKGAGWGCGYMDNKGTWIDTCSEEKFNSMYKYNALSVWNK